MLHLVPSWQSEERHRKLKIMMQDRPDLIQSELAGLAFDSLQQVFRKGDIALAFDTPGLPLEQDQMIWTVVDPAAGGPQSDYAIVSVCRVKGTIQVILMPIHTVLHTWREIVPWKCACPCKSRRQRAAGRVGNA